MIGLEHEKFKSSLEHRLQNYGVILDAEQPEEGIRFIGMGNKRKATVDYPDTLTDENMADEVEKAVKSIFATLRNGGE